MTQPTNSSTASGTRFTPPVLIPRPARLAVLISGSGRTLENFVDCIADTTLEAEIATVICSRPGIPGIARCRRLGLVHAVVERRNFQSAEDFSRANFEIIRAAGADLVCLAGYLQLLLVPTDFVGRLLNIHPALLPAFGGKGMYGPRVHQAVLAAESRESGCTVHLVDNVYDHGEVVLQRRIRIQPSETAETLADRVFAEECLAYPAAIRRLQGIAAE